MSAEFEDPDLEVQDTRLGEMRSALDRSRQPHSLPAVLSFFIPGLGQFLKGEWLKTILIWMTLGLCAVLAFFVIGFFIGGFVWLWQVYDAYKEPDAQTRRELKRLRGA